MDYTWTCRCCGKQFNTLPLDFAFHSPDQWVSIPETERKTRVKKNDDICIIDDKDRFVRGCLEVPIAGSNEVFIYGVWVSVSESSLKRIVELWDAEYVADEPPFFGWLCNTISIYPPTMHLKTNLHLRSSNQRPLIELEPTDHPLAVEQRDGISLERAQKIVAALMPRH